jgi:hypothetical protein
MDAVLAAFGLDSTAVPITVEWRWTGTGWEARIVEGDGHPATGWRTVNDAAD